MKNINDYKGTKTAIHCKTQEEWDKITELLGYVWNSVTWSVYKEKSCITISYFGAEEMTFYSERGFTIIPASDFITPRTIEQIDAELEVLRNELAMLKAEAQPKKKIEFVKYLGNRSMELTDKCNAVSDFDTIELLYTDDTFNYDIMKAYHKATGLYCIYLGHFNDGIK